MDTDELIESFQFRFKASGIRKPERTAEELVAHVFKCHPAQVHDQALPNPPSSGQMMQLIRELERHAELIESGKSPQEVLNCLDF
jgi:t-SNARE complex subunit (syntaxin)